MRNHLRQVGFFGCGHGDGKVVSVAPPPGACRDANTLRKLKLGTWRIDPCPNCGGKHVTKPLWRKARNDRETGEFKLRNEHRVSDGGKLARERRTARLASGRDT